MPVLAVMAAALISGAAGAQSVNQRQWNQAHRIGNGVASGNITHGEARYLAGQQRSINRQEDRMRARNGGHLTGRNRAVLRHRQNNASRDIYRAKRNYHHY